MVLPSFIFSLFIFFAMFSYAGAALLAVQFRSNRPAYIRYWIFGCIATGTGVIFLSLKEFLPELISYKFGNALVMAGGLFSNYALLSLVNGAKSYKKAIPVSIATGILVILALFLIDINFGYHYQPLLIGASNLLVFTYGFFLCHKYYRNSANIYAGTLTLTYLAASLIWVFRLATILYLNVGFAYQGGLINAVTYSVLLFVGLARYTLFTGLVLGIEESEKRKLIDQFHELKINFANQKVTQTEQRLQHVLDITGDGVWDWVLQTGEVKHNDRWLEMLGETPSQKQYSVEDYKSRIHPEDLAKVLDAINKTLEGGADYHLRYRMIRLDGRQIWVEDKGAIVEKTSTGIAKRMVGAIRDITEEVTAQEKIEELIFFDSLTKLPNRQFIKDRIQRAISESSRNLIYSGLMYLDLDDFKIVNDTYGHNIGDRLLEEFGRYLQNAVRPSDVVARIGGDEYLILFERVDKSAEDARLVLEEAIKRILADLNKEFELGEIIRVKTRASIGVVIFGGEKSDFNEVLKCADIAMYAAKEDQTVQYRFYDAELKEKFDRKNELQLRLKDASEEGQFFVEYQPVVDADQVVIGYEALARWMHPELGVVMPDDFIPFAEKSGQMNVVGESILQFIFSNQAFWSALNAHPKMILMINVSAHQLMNLGFAERFIVLAEEYQVPLDRIHIEVTEGAFLTDAKLAINVMDRLSSRGVKFVLDDFGTGYSSLAYLQRLPIHYLKLDKSFVAGMEHNKDDQIIIENILNLAKSLNLKVIAEGVETRGQFDLLLLKGCDLFQGWYFGKPKKIDQ